MLLLSVALVLSGCGRQEQSDEESSGRLKADGVDTVLVQWEEHAEFERVVGTVAAREHARMSAKVSGTLLQVPVLLGQRVVKNELLAEISAEEMHARLLQAQAQLIKADADYRRSKNLIAQDAITHSDLDNTEASWKIAQSAVSEAETMLGYAQVLAPFDGVIAARNVNEGDFTAPGNVLMVVENPHDLEVVMDVPESLIGYLSVGQQIQVELAKGVQLAVIREISTTADARSRTFVVKAGLSDSEVAFAGQFARAEIKTGQMRAIRVPETVVLKRGQLDFVYVVEEGQLNLRLVRPGRVRDGKVEILSGLNGGEQVAVSGFGAVKSR